ncbi:hypothetical protein GETHLI_02520 [Geothrix limicola]|uniref:Metanogen output domain-containing protein n=1 Tax=Geothrix limicola TaxID=2927978 RepID=A0ABQ5QC93_9BACT|nr:DUF6144 family protein [Geothrix limicola]GLH71750.1 hypothetical protein GETHLI_02520 [Geothrix limicola]
MESTRRSFLTSCTTGLCACGFSRLAAASPVGAAEGEVKTVKDPMPSKWIAALLPQLERNMDRGTAKSVLKGCAGAHFDHIDMGKQLAPYVGRLDAFLVFLSAEWGWKIDHDKAAGFIDIDEAKSYCVCPLVHKEAGLKSTLLCDCSEGFAEKMFSAVVGKPVKAEVVASIQRGAKSCRYRITL